MKTFGSLYPAAPNDIKVLVAFGLFGPNPPSHYLDTLAQHYVYWNTNALENPEIVVVFQRLGLGEDLSAYLLVSVVPTQAVRSLPPERVGQIVESVVAQAYADMSANGTDVIFSNTGVTVFTRPTMPNAERPFDGTLITTISNSKIGIGVPGANIKNKSPSKMLVPQDVVYTLTTVLVDQMDSINYIPLCIETAICVNKEWSYVGGYVSEMSRDNIFYTSAFDKARKTMSRLLKVTGLDLTERRGMVPEKSDFFSRYRG